MVWPQQSYAPHLSLAHLGHLDEMVGTCVLLTLSQGAGGGNLSPSLQWSHLSHVSALCMPKHGSAWQSFQECPS